MTQRFVVHPMNPQQRLLAQAASRLGGGGLGVIPTDACYVLACSIEEKEAMNRLRAIRGIDDKHLLTLLCRDLSEVSSYAMMDNRQYRFVKAWTPGPYTFVLPATKEVPRRLAHPSRRTIGVRMPAAPIVLGLLGLLGEPLVTSTLRLPGDEEALSDPDEIVTRLARRVEFVIDGGLLGTRPTTVVDMTGAEPLIRRVGLGGEAMAAAGTEQAESE